MDFTSINFVVFFSLVLLAYYIVPFKVKKYTLLIMSLVFYASFGIIPLFIILSNTFLTYLGANVLHLVCLKSRNRSRVVLSLLIIFQLLLLIGMKYVTVQHSMLGIGIPIGISFYTLNIIGYLIDVYRGDCDAEKNYFAFLLYVIYFPHILQGPIPRYSKLNAFLNGGGITNLSYEQLCHGIQLMMWGYVKKLVIADRISIFVDNVYLNLSQIPGTLIFLASIMYSIQIYMDFSGCVDIAIGASECMGIELTQNFRQPYLAESIKDFWRRWHISLSGWFRDYLYIPLGGNRVGKIRRWLNLLVVFLTSGFWHGVGWNFIIWGMIHGCYQIFESILQPIGNNIKKKIANNFQERFYCNSKVIMTFILVNFAWIFFRLENIDEAVYAIQRIITDIRLDIFTDGSILDYGLSKNQWCVVLFFIVIAFIVDILHEKNISIRAVIDKQIIVFRWMIYCFVVISILLFGVYGICYDAKDFIYMNF